MTTNFYDVVLLGTEFNSLLCGALLAKRGFRVLLLGQDDHAPVYEVEGMSLPRAPFTFQATHSPIARRILSELALHQLFRRRATAMDPSMQVALPGHRFDLPLDRGALDEEVEREFPEVRRPVEDFHGQVARVSGEFDRLVERDLVWPPETFFEKREFSRASAHQPFDRRGEGPDPLGELPEEHPFRLAVSAPVRFSTHIDPEQLNALARLRLYAGWLQGTAALEGGYHWLREALIDKIETYSGEVRRRERADRIETHRGGVRGVRIATSGEPIGSSFVVAPGPLSSLMPLLPDRGAFESIFERYGEPRPRFFRYTLNVVLAAEGVPVGMGRDVFFVPDPRRPLWGRNLLHIEAHPSDEQGRRVLCVEAMLPRSQVEDADSHHDHDGLREEILQTLLELLPLSKQHILWVDSPHDGRDVQDVQGHTLRPPPEPWHRGLSTMQPVYGFPARNTLGVCALPVRTPIKRLLLCGDQVVPGLGQEGSLLAAWSAARVVTKSDRKKEWMRRGLWTKVEI